MLPGQDHQRFGSEGEPAEEPLPGYQGVRPDPGQAVADRQHRWLRLHQRELRYGI